MSAVYMDLMHVKSNVKVKCPPTGLLRKFGGEVPYQVLSSSTDHSSKLRLFVVRRMTILLQWTYYILLHRTRMLLAELMFAMYGNANYEPDDDIILESIQIIPQTDEDCLDFIFDEPSWIAQKHRKIGII
ncbi:hypothetical protein AVEN_74387-1 [Araneus ventricosus]|uniref:Uncharacterized protein n=1 Tax=Araneus ventricosus TaxID=182803 RepID=A0A4Y2LQJ5_ARAVE|nr:hypothetical protein AVEN_74387-1 [Araneus ventricosus]